MLNITVSYYLSSEGKEIFQDWYEKVSKLSRVQDGFISINKEINSAGDPIVYLEFENQKKLNIWASSQLISSLKIDPL